MKNPKARLVKVSLITKMMGNEFIKRLERKVTYLKENPKKAPDEMVIILSTLFDEVVDKVIEITKGERETAFNILYEELRTMIEGNSFQKDFRKFAISNNLADNDSIHHLCIEFHQRIIPANERLLKEYQDLEVTLID